LWGTGCAFLSKSRMSNNKMSKNHFCTMSIFNPTLTASKGC
jgi:hypothetical protein